MAAPITNTPPMMRNASGTPRSWERYTIPATARKIAPITSNEAAANADATEMPSFWSGGTILVRTIPSASCWTQSRAVCRRSSSWSRIRVTKSSRVLPPSGSTGPSLMRTPHLVDIPNLLKIPEKRHRPPPTRRGDRCLSRSTRVVTRTRRPLVALGQDAVLDLPDADLAEADRLGGAGTEVEEAARDERSAVLDHRDDRLAAVGELDPGPERQGLVRDDPAVSPQGAATGHAVAVEARTVPRHVGPVPAARDGGLGRGRGGGRCEPAFRSGVACGARLGIGDSLGP